MGRAVAVLLLCAPTIAACARDSTEPVSAPRETVPAAQVVARVGSQSIPASAVEARMQADGTGPKAALDSLIDEALLVEEAASRGFTLTDEDERAIERLMVRAMLHDMERKITPESISVKEVQEDFAANADKLVAPERRRSWHILVKEPGSEGEALARAILGEVRRATDPRSVYDRYANAGGADLALPVEAEKLPAISMKAGIEKPYKDALFAAKSIGVLKNPVRTSQGWHVIFLEEIVPAEDKTYRDFEAEIRERLAQKKRFEAVVAIVEARRAQGLVSYQDQAVERLLATSGLPTRAP